MHTNAQTVSLASALDYTNEEVVYRFTTLYDVSLDEARELFDETKRWLWLAAQPDAPRIAIWGCMFILDEMWHNFVLFTREYTRYCNDKFGRFLHHAPTPQKEKERQRERYETDAEAVREEAWADLSEQCAYVLEKLGPETLIRWYVEYPDRYGEEALNALRRPISQPYSPPPELRSLAARIRGGQIRITT